MALPVAITAVEATDGAAPIETQHHAGRLPGNRKRLATHEFQTARWTGLHGVRQQAPQITAIELPWNKTAGVRVRPPQYGGRADGPRNSRKSFGTIREGRHPAGGDIQPMLAQAVA